MSIEKKQKSKCVSEQIKKCKETLSLYENWIEMIESQMYIMRDFSTDETYLVGKDFVQSLHIEIHHYARLLDRLLEESIK